jgi:DNA processing protein
MLACMEVKMEDKYYKLWFLCLEIKNADKINIIKEGISPYEFYKMDEVQYLNYGININNAEKIEKSKLDDKVKQTQDYLDKNGINIIFYTDFAYPESLKNIYNPPAGFFIKGSMPDTRNSIAVVGARSATQYGMTAAYKMSFEIASKGLVIISGMARGIDSCAHKGTIDAGGITVAVMGSGFKHIYPAQNLKLADEISKNGCIITEYAPDVMPFAYNFPERNRIISGLSKIVLVVEAGERSGSLITASLALEMGKDVMAVPGNIYSPKSSGTNKLIQDGAKLIASTDDILCEFGIESHSAEIQNLDENEKEIIIMMKSGGASLDFLMQNEKLNSGQVLSAIGRLECKGIIKKGFGNYYVLC